ncbi:hypothetical protein ACWKTZ_26610 [Bacillus cereus]
MADYEVIEKKDGEYKYINNIFSQKWYRSHSYTKGKSKVYGSKEIDQAAIQNKDLFDRYIAYAKYLYDNTVTGIMPKDLEEDAVRWDNEGCCIYNSVVLYLLLTSDDVVRKENIQYVQGMAKCTLSIPMLGMGVDSLGKPFTQERPYAGLHAWISIQESVIDLTTEQFQRIHFRLGRDKYILGKIPKGMELIGFPETEHIVLKLAKKFAKSAKMELEEWIAFHRNYANTLMR